MSLHVHMIFITIIQLWVIYHVRPQVKEGNPIHTYYLESVAGTGLVSNSPLELHIKNTKFSSTLHRNPRNLKAYR